MMTIRETARPEIQVPGFTGEQMGDIAHVALAAESARLATGVNAQDQPSLPLKPGYAAAKQRAGARGVRDLRFTGAMLAAREVSDSADNSASVGFADPVQASKAARNEQLEPMLGVSPADRREIDQQVQDVFSANVKGMNGR